MGLIDALLPAVRNVAQMLAGSQFAAEAEHDVQMLEQIAAKHASALEAELTQWLTARLHPQAAGTVAPSA